MRLYFACDVKKIDLLMENNIRNILVAYPFDKNVIKKCKELKVSLFVDSGAYSVSTGKKKIKHEDYINFIKETKPHLYASLDVIDNPEASKRNLMKELKEGLTPVPTYHQYEPIELLDFYVERFPYISLGGMVGTKNKQLRKFMDIAWSRIAKKRTNIKVHAFGKRIAYLKATKAQGEEWLNEDCSDLEVKLCQKFEWFISCPPIVQSVIIDMCYQMGLSGFSKFKKTIALLEHREYRMASKELLDSKYARKDTPSRAKENSELLASASDN